MILSPRAKWIVRVLPLVALVGSDVSLARGTMAPSRSEASLAIGTGSETSAVRSQSSKLKSRALERIALDDTIAPPARQGRAKIIGDYTDEFGAMHGDAKLSDFAKRDGAATRRPSGALTGPPKLTKGTGRTEPSPRKPGTKRLPRRLTGGTGPTKTGKPVVAQPQTFVTGSGDAQNDTTSPPARQGRAKIIGDYTDEFGAMHGDAKLSDFAKRDGAATRRPSGALTGPPKLTKGTGRTEPSPRKPGTKRLPQLTKGAAHTEPSPRKQGTARLPQRTKGKALTKTRKPGTARLPQRTKRKTLTKTRKPRTARSHTAVKKSGARSRATSQHPVVRGDRRRLRSQGGSVGRGGQLGRARAGSLGGGGSVGRARAGSFGSRGMGSMQRGGRMMMRGRR